MINKLVFAVFIFYSLSFSLVLGQSSCLENIKEGTFMYFSESDTSIIYRKQDFQIETTKGRDSRITSKIYWINENEYSLEIIEIENIELQYVEVGSVLHVVIDTCEQNYYDFTIYFNEYFVGPTRYYYDLEK